MPDDDAVSVTTRNIVVSNSEPPKSVEITIKQRFKNYCSDDDEQNIVSRQSVITKNESMNASGRLSVLPILKRPIKWWEIEDEKDVKKADAVKALPQDLHDSSFVAATAAHPTTDTEQPNPIQSPTPLEAEVQVPHPNPSFPRKIRNPIQESRQREEALRKLFQKTEKEQSVTQINGDDELWDWVDEAEKLDSNTHKKKSTTKSESRKRGRKSKTEEGSDKSEEMNCEEETSKTRESRDNDTSDDAEEDDAYLLHQLKPCFTNPKMGEPSALAPLILPRHSMPDDDKVPASINRYLQDYQRDGVRFMHSLLSQGLGAVLGGKNLLCLIS
jgi:hypothetical protein